MNKIFKKRKDLKIFAGMAIAFVLLLFSYLAARGFEHDWTTRTMMITRTSREDISSRKYR